MSEEKEKTKGFKIRSYTLKDLCIAYGVSRYVLKKQIKKFYNELGEKIGYNFTPKQVEIIVSKLGIPGTFAVDE